MKFQKNEKKLIGKMDTVLKIKKFKQYEPYINFSED